MIFPQPLYTRDIMYPIFKYQPIRPCGVFLCEGVGCWSVAVFVASAVARLQEAVGRRSAGQRVSCGRDDVFREHHQQKAFHRVP